MTINASEARKDFFGLIRRVTEDHAPERVTSKAGTVVIMSEEDYNAWEETMYLLRSPATPPASCAPSSRWMPEAAPYET